MASLKRRGKKYYAQYYGKRPVKPTLFFFFPESMLCS